MMLRVAIIGAGAAGVATLHAFTPHADVPLRIEVFDPTLAHSRVSARGLAYVPDASMPLLNAPAHVMSACARDSRDFARWHTDGTGSPSEEFAYATRPRFGDYLRDTLRRAVSRWSDSRGILHLVPETVESIIRARTGHYSLLTPTASHHGFDRVILCTGWASPPLRDDCAFPTTAYPLESLMDRIGDSPRVAILGTGLAGVDVARTMLGAGFDGTILMASRRGLLPIPRSEVPPMGPLVYTRERVSQYKRVTLTTAKTLMLGEARARGVDLTEPLRRLAGHFAPEDHLLRGLSGDDGPWASLFVDLADHVMTDTWNAFDRGSKRAFLRRLHPFFQSWCNPMPPSTARTLLSSMSRGDLVVRRGVLRHTPRSVEFEDGSVVRVESVVGAHRTSGTHFADPDAPLVRDIVARGLGQADEFGGLRLDFETSRVLDAQNIPHHLYAVGAPAQGARYYVNAFDGIVSALTKIVDCAIGDNGAHTAVGESSP